MDNAVNIFRRHIKEVDEALEKLADAEVLHPQELKKLLEAAKSKDYPDLLRNQVVLLYGLQIRLQAYLQDLIASGEVVNLRNQQLVRSLVTCVCAIDIQVEEKTERLLQIKRP